MSADDQVLYLDIMSDKRNPFASSSESEEEDNGGASQKHAVEFRDPNGKQ